MPKTLFIFLFLTSSLLFSQSALADIPSCTSVGIAYQPNSFPEDNNNLTFTFSINSDNVLYNLNSTPWVFLNIEGSQTSRVKIEAGKRTATFIVTDKKNRGSHTGIFKGTETENTSTGIDICSFQYQVGVGNECIINSSPAQIAPGENNKFGVNFLGVKDSQYSITLYQTNDNKVFLLQGTTTTKTDKLVGNGVFENLYMNGGNGNFELRLRCEEPFCNNACKAPIQISINAPPLPTATPTLVPGAPTYTPTPTPIIIKSGGEPCNVDGVNGIQTAIGCIPTQPQALIQGILRFTTGAGGGIALLLMIWGAFQMITSAGNPESVKKGADQITSAIIGLLFIIFSVLLLQVIGVDILDIKEFTP
ncbi:MAG: pilin [Candidatus Daviesbacteria bacterium]